MPVVELKLCQSYMLLKAEHASFLSLLRLLFSSDARNLESFVESSEPVVLTDFCWRWIIFISIFVQKMLLYFKNPLAYLGYIIEMWLNLLSNNGGFCMLLLHIWKGTVVIPDKKSASFWTVIGHLDKRVDLDKSIIHDIDNLKYGASLSIMAAKLSYENEACVQTVVEERWKMELLGYFNFWNAEQKTRSTHAIMFKDITINPNLIVVAFRGTSPFDAYDWMTDIDLSWHEIEGVGKVHSGFMKALGLQNNGSWPKQTDTGPEVAYYTIREKLKKLLAEHKGAKFILAGHSLGGALAVLFVSMLALYEETWLLEKLNGVYTFGQPRVGNKQFGKFIEEKFKVNNVRYLRYVYCNDIVPRLPFDYRCFLYKHFGICQYYNSCYRGKALDEEPNKNYFSLFMAIPMLLNAFWELIRSFIIPYTKGNDYKEGWFMRLARLFGLAAPGLVAHIPQDYNNVTRLGKLPSQIHRREINARVPKQD